MLKNTAVTGFPIGQFINATTGAVVTTGSPTCKRILDGTGAACANAASYNADAGQWEIDLAAADTNGDMVGLSFTLADCLPITYRFATRVNVGQVGASPDAATNLKHVFTGAGHTNSVVLSAKQLKLTGDVESEGCLHVHNTNADGYGQYNRAGYIGVLNWGAAESGMECITDTGSYGMYIGGYEGLHIQGTTYGLVILTGASEAVRIGGTINVVDVGVWDTIVKTDLVAAIEAEIADDATGEAVKQAIVAKLLENLPDLDELTLAAIASSVASAILTTPANKLKTNASGQVEYSNTSPLDADGVRSAVGLATANLDTQLAGKALEATSQAILEDTGTTLPAAISGISGGTGTGARSVVITVNDGDTILQSAKVRFTKGAESYVGTTNASGQVSFSLDDGTWSVAISLAGYTFTPTTLVVDGDETQTYSMTVVTVPVSDTDLVTGYLYCYDDAGELEADVIVQLQFYELDGTGYCFDTALRSATSDANGLVTFTNLFPGAAYKIRRGQDQRWTRILVPTTAVSPLALTSILGVDA